MTREEFERLKEAEKAHLRKLKELKQTLAGARRIQSSRQALDDMMSGSRDILDENDGLVERLSQDAAISEARVDMALDSESERNREADAEEIEEELRKARAQELVRRMRQQITPDTEGTAAPPAADAPEEQRASSEKTIGKPQELQPDPRPEPEGKGLPEKTIGRVKP